MENEATKSPHRVETIAAIRQILNSFPRLVGQLAVEIGATEPVLLGMLDKGVGLTGLLDAAEMHGEFEETLAISNDDDSPLAVYEQHDGWVPGVAQKS